MAGPPTTTHKEPHDRRYADHQTRPAMIEHLSVLVAFLGLLYVLGTICHHIAQWSLRTPRSGYLILASYALFVFARTLH